MENLKKTGIYKITNAINNKTYIGSAAGKHGIQQRFQDHRKALHKNRHRNIHLQRAWNRYGENSFSFEVIEYCDKFECILREQHYIDTLIPDYNICKIAGNTAGINCEDLMSLDAIKIKRQKQSQNISKALKNKKKSDEHAIRCGAKYFNVYKAVCAQQRKRGQSAIYIKGTHVGRWLKRSECASILGIDEKFIRRCLQNIRTQSHGYIFEYEVA